MKDRDIVILFGVLVALLLIGEAYVTAHPGSRYSSEVTVDPEGFGYSFESGPSSVFEMLVLDNGAAGIVSEVFVYSDASHGCTKEWTEFARQLHLRLRDRGFSENSLVDTANLLEVLAGPAVGKAVVMGDRMPEEVFGGALLNWVHDGGTLYWAEGCIGSLLTKADGSVYSSGTTLESEFYGASSCTSDGTVNVFDLEHDTPISECLGLHNDILSGALRKSLLPDCRYALGYTDGDLTEIAVMKCGNGTVVNVAGTFNEAHVSDLAQVVCSGICADSVFVGETSRTVDGKMDGRLDVPVTAGHEYSVYVFVTGYNPPYGTQFRLSL